MSGDMIAGLEARGARLGTQRVAAMLDAVAGADLPAGFSTERGEDAVIVRGPGLVRRLAFDARLQALTARGA